MKQEIATPRRDQNSLRITDYSVLMQARAMVLNDLRSRIPADYYSSRAVSSKLVIHESDNLDRIRHLARVDFYLAKELVAENDRGQAFTPREVSAIQVLGDVGYCAMFLALDGSERTADRLGRMREAESALRGSLDSYVLHLDEDAARPIRGALAVAIPLQDVEAASKPTGGTETLWTRQRKDAARAMLDSERGRGVKAYAANTAAAFGVSTARLRQVLRDETKKNSTRKPASLWPT